MGGASSDAKTLTDEIWNKDIKDMFSSAKMTEPYNFSSKFCFNLFYQQNQEKNSCHCFISPSGEINCISEVLPDIDCSAKIDENENPEVLFAEKIFDNKVAISTNNNFYVVEYKKSSLEIKECGMKEISYIIPAPEKSFFCLSKTGNLIKATIKDNDTINTEVLTTISDIFDPKDSTFFFIESIKLCVFSTKNATYFAYMNDLTNFVKQDQIKGITKLVSDNHDLYFTSEKTNNSQIHHIVIPNDIIPPQLYDKVSEVKDKKIIDIAIPLPKTLFVLYEKYLDIACFDQRRLVEFHPDFIAKQLFPLERPNFVLIIAQKGKIMLLKFPDIQSQQDNKEKIKQVELSDLHKCEIEQVLSCNESFITFDEKHTLIKWENLPNWWNAPHFLDMFGENQAFQSAQNPPSILQ